MSRYLEQVGTIITDPNKLRKLGKLPDEILGLIVQSGLTESDFDVLRKFNIAYKARGLYRMKAVDYGSPMHKDWYQREKIFTKHKEFISIDELFQPDPIKEYKHYDALSMSKIELISPHAHYLGDLGIEVVGAIPIRKDRVELLIKHNQIRWLPDHTSRFGEEMMELNSEDLNIPKEVCIGELKRDALFFFTMKPLDKQSNYYDVVIPT